MLDRTVSVRLGIMMSSAWGIVKMGDRSYS